MDGSNSLPPDNSDKHQNPDLSEIPEPTTIQIPEHDHPTEHIGPYHLLGVLGEGGMGTVFLAEQREPVQRKVALKVIKLGMDTREVIGRFEAERQALAMMNHTNIAQVHDAGTTEAGRPYFVMEYVPGVPINDYCDQNRLGIRQRLELFIPVCQAIHHAHQKGVIHRDIKSSNVLVTVQDGKPLAKVIDFGVAKATEKRLTEKTLFTAQGQLIGTPDFMSPEQAEMTGLNIDTTSDVYSLGVMLYELLTGTLPFEHHRLRELGPAEIHRVIREVSPPRPSQRICSLGDQAVPAAERRRRSPSAWAQQVRNELDWITIHALEKDRTRRYQSASEFAADIERYLKDEPVLATSPSTLYQLRKLIARNKVRFGLVVSLVLVLAGFAVTMSIQTGRISRERDRANQEARSAQQVSEFLSGLFEVFDPSETRGNILTAREILDESSAKVESEFTDQPLVGARLLGTLGRVYGNLGLFAQARPLLERALVIRQDHLDEQHLDVAQSLLDLGILLWQIGDYQGARPRYERSLTIREATLGPDHPLVAASLNNLAVLLMETGDHEGARPLYERALAIAEVAFGSESPQVATSLDNLGILHWRTGDHEGARSLYERGLAIREATLGSDHPQVATSLNNLAVLFRETGDNESARPLYERALTIREKALGPNHPHVAFSLNNLAVLFMETGDHAGARPLYARALAIGEIALGREHPSTLSYLYNLVCLASIERDRDQAIGFLLQLLERGYRDEQMWIARDPDLEFLHGDPEFEAVIAEIQKRNEEGPGEE
ncbi:MAG: serine/threonine-protein kinase [bacterium]